MKEEIGQVSFYPSIIATCVSQAIYHRQQEADIDRKLISKYNKTPDQLTPEEKDGLAGN